MTDQPAGERTNEQICADHLARRIRLRADTLRKLADKAERHADEISYVGQERRTPSYASVVADLHDDIAWGVANMQLPELARHAQEADEYRTRTRDAEQIAKRIESAGTLDGGRWQDVATRIAREYGEKADR